MVQNSRAALSERDADFVRAVALFNAGRYFESHEAWERLWLRADGNHKALLQGLIQAAAAMLHLERGNLRGARSLHRKAQARLEAVPDEFAGLSVGEFRAALESFILVALDGSRATMRPQLRRIPQRQD
jgi:predicted metal-dependent hydrolase